MDAHFIGKLSHREVRLNKIRGFEGSDNTSRETSRSKVPRLIEVKLYFQIEEADSIVTHDEFAFLFGNIKRLHKFNAI